MQKCVLKFALIRSFLEFNTLFNALNSNEKLGWPRTAKTGVDVEGQVGKGATYSKVKAPESRGTSKERPTLQLSC
jgi:hypothetical protein